LGIKELTKCRLKDGAGSLENFYQWPAVFKLSPIGAGKTRSHHFHVRVLVSDGQKFPLSTKNTVNKHFGGQVKSANN
jgi:hypothetical protein